jgi:hypothetical protein
MARKLRHLGPATLLLAGFLSGCHKSSLQHKDPPDPLLVTKKPVAGRRAPTGLAQQEATPPPAPGQDNTPTSVRRDTLVPIQPVRLRIEPLDGGR